MTRHRTTRNPASLLISCVAAVATLALSSVALAASPSPIIVLKSRVGATTGVELDSLTPELDAQLEAVGFAARPAAITSLLGARLPRPGILDPKLSATDIIQPIELGYDMWTHGLFEDAVKKLEPALSSIARNPGLLVTDTKNLDSTFKGLVALSLSQSRLGKAAESAETMAELIRMFQSRPVSRSEFGRPAEQFWRTISKQVLAGGIGQLSITTGNRQAVVFVDGQIRGIEHAAVADLVPGVHHVFVQVPATAGRQYDVEIKANENVDLNVSWDIDNSLTVTGPWIGFVFATEAERNKEALFAGQLAKRWGQSMVAVVGTFRLQGTPMLIGTLYQAGGKVVRSAATSLEGDRVAMMRSLARYLADGTVGSGVKIMSSSGEAAVALSDIAPARGARSQVPAFALGAAGAVALVAGGVLYANAQPTSSIFSDAQARTIYTMVGGSVLLGGGTYLWLRNSGLTSERSAVLLGGGVAAIASAAVLLLVDQDPSPNLPISIRDTTSSGLAVGATGLVLTGLGIWLWQKPDGVARRDSSQVTFSPSTGGGRVSYSRTF